VCDCVCVLKELVSRLERFVCFVRVTTSGVC